MGSDGLADIVPTVHALTSRSWRLAHRLFLIPVRLMLHKFWTVSDPMMAQIQMILFMKNVSMLGGALVITQLEQGRSVWMPVARADSA